jgi:hypothetical protein
MNLNISKFTNNINSLNERKRKLTQEYERNIKEIDAEIVKEKTIIDNINEALQPYLCTACNGSGEESFLDAAGSKDHRPCRHCKGSGFDFSK